MTDEASGRPGSTADLVRRVERLEGNLDNLTATVSRVEHNQETAEKLNEREFKLVHASVANIGANLDRFMTRIEGLISGEVQTAQTRQGAEMVADYQRWRANVDKRLPDEHEVEDYREWRLGIDAFVTQGRFLGKLAVILIGGQALLILGGLAAIVKP